MGRINRFSRLRLDQSCFLLESGLVLMAGRTAGSIRSARLSLRRTNELRDVVGQSDSRHSARVCC